jgi:hypothetical protein
MSTHAIIWAFLIAICTGSTAMGANLMYLELDDSWQATQQGRFQVWHDMRDLLVIHHPFDASATGDFGAVRRMARVPQTWEPPFTLSFYCTDDYLSDETEKPTGGSTHDAFPGHRFKQVLVDGAVVWESDVADWDGYGNRDLIHVDLTPHVEAGKPFELSLRVLDRVGTETQLDSDFIYLSWQNPGGPGEGAIEGPLNCSWNTPTLLYYLHKYRNVEARLPWERPGRVLAP